MQLANTLWGIAFTTPWLILYLVAAILGLVNLKRHKQAATFVVLGALMGGLATLGGKVATELLWANANTGGGGNEGTLLLSRLITMGVYLVEVVGIGMIVFAVFAGRKQPPRDDDDDRPRRDRRDGPPMARPSRPSD